MPFLHFLMFWQQQQFQLEYLLLPRQLLLHQQVTLQYHLW